MEDLKAAADCTRYTASAVSLKIGNEVDVPDLVYPI
jgi:hypothetical protein